MIDLPAEIIETSENPEKVVIWLHGLGSSGHDFVPIAHDLNLPLDIGIRFIFPHAPSIPITINNGFVMPAWYDVVATGLDRKVDVEQLSQSATLVKKLIGDQISKGIDSENIIIAGFSQGGAVAYETVLSFDRPLGGLLTMSTYFATKETITLNDANSRTPVYIQHGVYDNIVDISLSEKALEWLKVKSFEVEYSTYKMEHSVCNQQLNDISKWFVQILA